MFAFPTIDPNALAGICAALGAVIVKITERWVGKRTESFSEGERLRRELREELYTLREEAQRLRQETDMWREKYWNLHEDNETNEHRISALNEEMAQLAFRMATITAALDHPHPQLFLSGSL